MSRWSLLLIVHVVLLVLASTSFTVVTWMDEGTFHWQYFWFVSRTAWGFPYEFPYSLPVVLTYLVAYTCGLAVYVASWRRAAGPAARLIAGMGILLCAAGLGSFAHELTHWFSNHANAWILSAPALLFVLAILAALTHSDQRPTPAAA